MPEPTQAAPPPDGEGLLQVLVRVRVVIALLQVVHCPHAPQFPFTVDDIG